ncbi:HNH endonuclease, partial [Escherichia coli]|nr:HNH endonuclease [Escherichia coli]
MKNKKPIFIIKRKSQKGTFLFSDIFTHDVLSDICFKITGRNDYSIEYDDSGYNKGRLAKLFFDDEVSYISVSENKASGRNSSFQSVPSALVLYHNEELKNKNIFFYFINHEGNVKTKYFNFMYRLMATSGFVFLNDKSKLGIEIKRFNNIDDLILNKDSLRGRNKSNNSSYITLNDEDVVQIYAKTYGANKKESTLMCLALSNLNCKKVELIQVSEGNLTKLPKPDLAVIQRAIEVLEIQSNNSMEKDEFIRNNSLRSPTYVFNLLSKLGKKKCVFCDCEIPQIIQGAHIWPVSEIKKLKLNDDEKIKHALSENNGIWLCENHHKLYDRNIIIINESGEILIRNNIFTSHKEYIEKIT